MENLQEIYPEIRVFGNANIVLASASPRRRELLGRLLPANRFTVLAADIDESVLTNEKPFDYVRRLAIGKAAKGAEMAQTSSQQDLLVIGADTSVVLGDKIYGKPGTPENAAIMLAEIAGKTHQVMSGVAVHLVKSDGSVVTDSLVCTTDVEMRPMSRAEIDWYVATGEPFDKAGGYAVQGYGGVLVAAVRGDYYNVVGLPLGPLVEMLRKL